MFKPVKNMLFLIAYLMTAQGFLAKTMTLMIKAGFQLVDTHIFQKVYQKATKLVESFQVSEEEL